MRYYDYENAMQLWLRGADIGRTAWNIDEVSLEVFWENLDEEDLLADDYIIYTDEVNEELEYLRNENEELRLRIMFLENQIKMLNKIKE